MGTFFLVLFFCAPSAAAILFALELRKMRRAALARRSRFLVYDPTVWTVDPTGRVYVATRSI